MEATQSQPRILPGAQGPAGSTPASEIFTRQPENPAVIVADGYGVQVNVKRGHLVIQDGIGRTRRTRRIPRIDGKTIARIVILGDTGYFSLESLRWCADAGITIVQADRTGRLVMSAPGQAGDARLRAVQSFCQPGASLARTGLTIVRQLMAAKLAGQARNASEILASPETASRITEQAGRLAAAQDIPGILACEGNAAGNYWRAWGNRVHVPFIPSGLGQVPVHWYKFARRIPLNSRTAQNAIDPVNAMLNYAYRICEIEARNACYVNGLEPGLGFGHGHDKGEDALVLDLMEAVRPEADRAILRMLDCGHGIPAGPDGRPAYFKPGWFHETPDGTCRLLAPLTHMVTERVILAVAKTAGSHTEAIARELAHISSYDIQPARIISADRRIPEPSATAPRAGKLDASLTPRDVVPDAVWTAILPLIPPEPVVRTHKPVPRADARAVLAGILCHEIHGAPWNQIPPGLNVSRKTCRRRLEEWKRLGAWDAIVRQATRPGISRPV